MHPRDDGSPGDLTGDERRDPYAALAALFDSGEDPLVTAVFAPAPGERDLDQLVIDTLWRQTLYGKLPSVSGSGASSPTPASEQAASR